MPENNDMNNQNPMPQSVPQVDVNVSFGNESAAHGTNNANVNADDGQMPPVPPYQQPTGSQHDAGDGQIPPAPQPSMQQSQQYQPAPQGAARSLYEKGAQDRLPTGDKVLYCLLSAFIPLLGIAVFYFLNRDKSMYEGEYKAKLFWVAIGCVGGWLFGMIIGVSSMSTIMAPLMIMI